MNKQLSLARSALTPTGAEIYARAVMSLPASVETVKCIAGCGNVPVSGEAKKFWMRAEKLFSASEVVYQPRRTSRGAARS